MWAYIHSYILKLGNALCQSVFNYTDSSLHQLIKNQSENDTIVTSNMEFNIIYLLLDDIW